MCIKVKCFTKIESKCLITNNKKRGPETIFVPARETTYLDKVAEEQIRRVFEDNLGLIFHISP